MRILISSLSIFVFIFAVSCSTTKKNALADSDNLNNSDIDQIASGDTDQTGAGDKDTAKNDTGGSDYDYISATCGNSTVEETEVCDGGIKLCTDIDPKLYKAGKAKCKADCNGWDTETCEEIPHTCGNSILEGPEICDGDMKNCIEIDSKKFASGKAKCKDDCTGWDTVTCDEVKAECGNGIIEGAEFCDGDSKTCYEVDNKYMSGTAKCNGTCAGWDTSTCVEGSATCGNSTVEGGELCDGGVANCIDIDSTKFSSGKAKCNSTCNGYQVETCVEITADVDWTGGKTVAAQFPARSGLSAVIFKNKIWVIGGAGDSAYYNDVWSSADGENWVQETAAAAFQTRTKHGSVVFQNKMWVIGGVGAGGATLKDIWSSEDGKAWTQVTPVPTTFAAGSNFSFVVYNNEMWIVTGNSDAFQPIEAAAWHSADGQHWTNAGTLPFSARYAQSFFVLNDQIFLAGGLDAGSQGFTDVWYTQNGKDWDSVTGSFGIRAFHQSIVIAGKAFIIGGNPLTGQRKNDVWVSENGGDWTLVTANAGFQGVSSHRAVVFGNKVCVIGGVTGDQSVSTTINSVWCGGF